MKLYLGSPENPPMEVMFGDGWLTQHVSTIWGLSIGTAFFGFFRIDKTKVNHERSPNGRIITSKPQSVNSGT